MINNISIIGGDLRIIKLVKMLSDDGFSIKTYGLDNSDELNYNKNIEKCEDIKQTIENSQIIIGPLPFSKDSININSPFSKKEISIEELIYQIKGKKLIAGNIKSEIVELMLQNNIEVIDLMKIEKLTILNTISTAEGAIQIAMEETLKTLFESEVLILGFGRVGKTVALKFKAMGAKVSCEARKEEDLAWIRTYGYNPVNLQELDKDLNKYDIIINTIPTQIIGEKELEKINKKSLIIDLASAPGGVDHEKAKKKGIKTVLALALPGKVAPETSAEFIKEVLYEII